MRFNKPAGRAAAAGLGLVAAAAVLTACQGHGSPGTAGSGDATAAAAASSARAFASGAAGQAARNDLQGLAGTCTPTGGYNALLPGQPGARGARKKFEQCEKIPVPKIPAFLECIYAAIQAAPAKGAQGSPQETKRQTAIEDGAATCDAKARGIKLPAATATPKVTAKATATPSPKTTGSGQ